MTWKKAERGITLIELMVVVVTVAVVSAIAYPSYTQYVAKGARSEGLTALMRIANLQEQHYLDFRSYTTDMTDLGLSASPFVSEQGYYSITASVGAGGDSFELTATAKGVQATRDADCSPLTLKSTGDKGTTAGCW